jgi:hypothetical protein
LERFSRSCASNWLCYCLFWGQLIPRTGNNKSKFLAISEII